MVSMSGGHREAWGGGIFVAQMGGMEKWIGTLSLPQARDTFLGRQYLHFNLLTPHKSQKVVSLYCV